MSKKEKKKLSLNEYIDIGKGEIYAYILVTICLFLILLYFGYRVDFYYVTLLDVIVFLRVFEKIGVYHNLNKIKKYLVENNLIEKVGNIDFWNERNYLLTDNYMIILQNKKIYAFRYSEIKELYKENKLELSRWSVVSEYLHIVTNDNEFKVLTWTTSLVVEEFRDITNYLLNKNPHIKINTNKSKSKNKRI